MSETFKLNVSAMEYQQEALFDFTTPFCGVSGGKRSGKSRMITCLKAIILSSLHPGKPGLIASPTYGMTRRNILPIFRELRDELGIQIEGLDTMSPACLTIKWGGKTSTIWLDCTIENYARLNGMSLAWACVDETDKAKTDIVALFIEELTFRISNPYPGRSAQINITGAPELNGYMAEFFVEKAAPDRKLYKWSLMQNEMLSEEYKQRILSTIPEKKQAGWVHGEFMYNTDGLVYDEFDPLQNTTDLTLSDLKPLEKVQVCWDINDGGTSAVIGIRRGQFLHIVDEWMKLKDTSSVIAKVKQQKWVQQAVLSCDPACTQVFPYIHQSGLKHAIMQSAPEIEWRVTAVNTLFGTQAEYNPGVKRRRLLINTSKCKVLNKCLKEQGYIGGKPDKKSWIEAAGTDISGPLDALGYLVYREFPYNPHGTVAPIKLRGF